MEITYKTQQNNLNIYLTGNIERLDTQIDKQQLYQIAQNEPVHQIVIQAQKLDNWDSSLIVVLYQLAKIAQERHITFNTDSLPKDIKQLLNLSLAVNRKPIHNDSQNINFLENLGQWGINVFASIHQGLLFLKDCTVSVARFCIGKATMRRVDFWQMLDDCGPKALMIVTLISFMVGLILAFVGAIQLKLFGAQIFVASLVTIGMIRIMGAIMVGIIMAGRTGASYAATIGTMQVNEETDALKTMGIPVSDFLVLPRILALVITMPLLVLLSDFTGILGGAFVGTLMLDIPPEEYWKYALEAFDLTNFLVGIFHGFVFGIVISLCGCYFGVHCGRNADSVGIATTNAVVWSIVWMIVLTGIITFVCEVIGI